MNWDFIILQIVALLGIISFTIVAIYYVRHRHTKARSIQQQQLQVDIPEGGKFLKRYIPPEHRSALTSSPKKAMLANRFFFYSACMLIPLMVLGITVSNYYSHREEVLEDIVLLDAEIDQLSNESYSFDSLLNPYAPNLSDVMQSIPDSLRVAVYQKRGSNENRVQAWQVLLNEYRVPFGVCSKQHINECRFRDNSTVILSLDDVDEAAIGELAIQGNNVIAFGVPTDVNGSKSYIKGLTFTANNQPVSSRLAVVGDRELTLGIDAGSNFYVPRIGGNASVESDRPQAVSMYSDGIAGGDSQTRVYATLLETKNDNKARVVWMDYGVDYRFDLQDLERSSFESVLAGIIRYATEQKFSALATWPNGYKYAAYFEQDTEDGYANSVAVSDLFDDLDMPLTWYVLSNLANDNRAITRKLASTGEMACHGDNHDIMTRYSLEGQIERLARCIKVVTQITGQIPTGFRPPTEAHDANTLAALANVGMTHIFAENTTSTQVPHIKQSVAHNKSIVSFPRGITDDFYLWHDLRLDKNRSIARMQDELDWIKEVSSLFSFSFHSQFMDKKEFFNVVKYLATVVSEDDNVYVDSVGNMAQWWRFRDSIMRGMTTDASLYERFDAVLLQVGDSGELLRSSVKHRSAERIEIADIDSE